MKTSAKTAEEYIEQLPEERKEPVKKLREAIIRNLPAGFEETISYGMIGYVVPHSVYPEGYHTDREMPLPFINLASQKNHIAVYHMGLVVDENLLDWFIKKYISTTGTKPDIGKSCIRLRKIIPDALIGELCTKISVSDWINTYESSIKR